MEVKVRKSALGAAWYGAGKEYKTVNVPDRNVPRPVQRPVRQVYSKQPSYVRQVPEANKTVMSRGYKSRTEAKIAPGIRAPDVEKGYKKPFDYHLWNKLRKMGRVTSSHTLKGRASND